MNELLGRFELTEGTAAVTAHRDAWDRLAATYPSPFLTHAWLTAWAQVSPQHLFCATLVSPAGELLAGALLRRAPGGLASGADESGGDWDVVAAHDAARRALWEEIAGLAPARLHLTQMRVDSPETTLACQVLASRGYGILPSVREESCPYVVLPASFEELLATRSSSTRREYRRRWRDLNRAGQVSIRTTTAGPNLERDWARFLHVEASGWKGKTRTAIITRPDAKAFYDQVVRDTAERGWLRLTLLELDGAVVGGQLAFSFGGEAFLIKTGFDESYASLGPGAAIQAEVLREAVEEGLRGADLLGAADPYKMRWTDQLRPRQRLRVFRGSPGRLAQRTWCSLLHPGLVALRDRAREDDRLRQRLEQGQRVLEIAREKVSRRT